MPYWIASIHPILGLLKVDLYYGNRIFKSPSELKFRRSKNISEFMDNNFDKG